LFTGCASEEIQSQWTEAPITVDGQNTDWDAIPFTYLKDFEISLGICNDADNIYIMLKFRDPKLLMAASRKGFTAWFDKCGTKKKEFGIRYICNPRVNVDPTRGERPEFGGPFRQRMQMLGDQKPVTEQLLALLGSEEKGINLKLDGSLGPTARLGNLNGVFAYELSVPFDHMGKGLYALETEAGSDISVGFEINNLSRPPGGSKRGGRPGGMGDRPPGGMGGGRGGKHPNRDMRGGSQDQDIWIKYTLATSLSQEKEIE